VEAPEDEIAALKIAVFWKRATYEAMRKNPSEEGEKELHWKALMAVVEMAEKLVDKLGSASPEK
jgi:hypothetical protein